MSEQKAVNAVIACARWGTPARLPYPMAYVTVSVPLGRLATARPRARFAERVHALAVAYQTGLPVPSIPVYLSQDGKLRLRRDGNHRLAAARKAGMQEIVVNIDERDLDRLTRPEPGGQERPAR